MLIPVMGIATPLQITTGAGIIGNVSVKNSWQLKTHNIVMQKKDFSCGSASLATILTYYLSSPTDESEIINYILHTGDLEKIIERKGFSLLDLKRFAKHKGFIAQGYRMNLEDLIQFNVPVLLPIVVNGYRHFVIYRGEKNGRIFLADPSFGNITLPASQFKKAWHAYQNVGMVITKRGYKAEKGKILTIKDEDEIYISGLILRALTETITPLFIAHPMEW